MGPPPPNCEQRLDRSVFPRAAGLFHGRITVAFAEAGFPSRVARAQHLLAAAGYPSTDDGRRALRLPQGGWHCRTLKPDPAEGADVLRGLDGDEAEAGAEPLPSSATAPMSQPDGTTETAHPHPSGHTPDTALPSEDLRALTAALILGMCAPGYFSPERPVVWSEARLARKVMLLQRARTLDP